MSFSALIWRICAEKGHKLLYDKKETKGKCEELGLIFPNFHHLKLPKLLSNIYILV